MAEKTSSGPSFRTAEEHDVYLFGLMCGAISAIKSQCEDPGVVGVEPVEDVLVNMAAYLESALEFAESVFEKELIDKLAGTRISIEAITGAWELGLRNGLQTQFNPQPELVRSRKRSS